MVTNSQRWILSGYPPLLLTPPHSPAPCRFKLSKIKLWWQMRQSAFLINANVSNITVTLLSFKDFKFLSIYLLLCWRAKDKWKIKSLFCKRIFVQGFCSFQSSNCSFMTDLISFFILRISCSLNPSAFSLWLYPTGVCLLWRGVELKMTSVMVWWMDVFSWTDLVVLN